MKQLLILLTLLLSAHTSANTTNGFSLNHISVSGRSITHTENNDPHIAYSWPGVSLTTGIHIESPIDSLSVGLAGSAATYQISIKHAQQPYKPVHALKFTTRTEQRKYSLPVELGKGRYHIALTKVSENTGPHLRFYGFDSHPSITFFKPKTTPQKRIQFFTDSHGVGYGNESHSRKCSQQERFSSTNNLKAYPQITAALLSKQDIDTESFSQSYSGIGVVRNWGGHHRYRFDTFKDSILLDQPNRHWNYSQDYADLIVLELGHNDFSTPLHSIIKEEPWRSQKVLEKDWQQHAKQLLRDLQQRYRRGETPVAVIVMATALPNGDRQRPMAKKLVTELQPEMPIQYLDYAAAIPAQTGCHGHPNTAEHKNIAKLLADKALSIFQHNTPHSSAND